MGLGAGIKAGKAFVEFVLSDKKLDGQLAGIGKKFTKLGSMGLAATAPIIAGFGAAVSTFMSVAGALDDLSDRTGISVEKLSELQFAAEQNDATLGDLEKAFRSLQDKGIDPARFDEVAADIAAIEDPTARAQAAMDLFGKKTGAALLPMMMVLPEAERQARDLAATLSTEDAAAADKLGKALDAAKSQLTILAVQIGAAIAGPLTDFLKWAQESIAWVIRFMKEHPNMVSAFAAITLGVAGVSAAMVILGGVMTLITLHPIALAVTLIVGAIIGLVTWLATCSDGFGGFLQMIGDVLAWLNPFNKALAFTKWVLEKISNVGSAVGGWLGFGGGGGAGKTSGVATTKLPTFAGANGARNGMAAPLATATSSGSRMSDQYGAAIAANTAATATILQQIYRQGIRSPQPLLSWLP